MNTDWCVRQCLNPDYELFNTIPKYSCWYLITDASTMSYGNVEVKSINGTISTIIINDKDIVQIGNYQQLIKEYSMNELKDAIEGWIDLEGNFYGCDEVCSHIALAREAFHTSSRGLELLGFVKTMKHPLRDQPNEYIEGFNPYNVIYYITDYKRLTQKQYDTLIERGFKIRKYDMPL